MRYEGQLVIHAVMQVNDYYYAALQQFLIKLACNVNV